MRYVRTSKTYEQQRNVLLDYGTKTFGYTVADQKRRRLEYVIETFLVEYPVRARDSIVHLYLYSISQTPFVVVYDYTDTELRVHALVHKRTSKKTIKKIKIVW
jgi:plasmid stabilization system protein ParE